jgi:hypothetical protein
VVSFSSFFVGGFIVHGSWSLIIKNNCHHQLWFNSFAQFESLVKLVDARTAVSSTLGLVQQKINSRAEISREKFNKNVCSRQSTVLHLL